MEIEQWGFSAVTFASGHLFLPVRSMSCFMLGSISVKISWKWSLTAAKTARWAGKGRPFVRSVMSQNSPASCCLLSLLSISALCDVIVFETHPLATTSTRQKCWDWQYSRDNTVRKNEWIKCWVQKNFIRMKAWKCDSRKDMSKNNNCNYFAKNKKIWDQSLWTNILPRDSLSSLELVLLLTFVLVCRLWHSGQPRTKSLIWKYIPVRKLHTEDYKCKTQAQLSNDVLTFSGLALGVWIDCMKSNRQWADGDVHTFPPVVFSHTFVGLFQGQVMLIRLLTPVNSADGLMSPVLIQHLSVVNKAPLKLLAVEQPVPHLEARWPGLEISTPFWILDFLRLPIPIPAIIRPGFGRAERLCVRITSVGAIAGHFHCLFTDALFLSVDLQPYLARPPLPCRTRRYEPNFS